MSLWLLVELVLLMMDTVLLVLLGGSLVLLVGRLVIHVGCPLLRGLHGVVLLMVVW